MVVVTRSGSSSCPRKITETLTRYSVVLPLSFASSICNSCAYLTAPLSIEARLAH